MEKPDFIEIDTEKDEKDLVELFEQKTQKTLYPAQNERIMISLIAYYASILKNKFNDAARLNLVQFSRYPFLDFIGELFDCKRLKAQKGESVLKITLNEPFSRSFTIPAGLEVQTKDNKYIFVTKKSVTFLSNGTEKTVEIESVDAVSDVNNYGTGDINILLKPYSYIKSVENITDVKGGSDEEADEDYIERIMLSPESFSCAGSEKAYIYFAKSAHTDIKDVKAESPQLPLTVEYNGETKTAQNGIISDENYNISVDYTNGEMTFTVDGKEFLITLPPAATVKIYPLTKTGVLSEEIKTAVEENLSKKEHFPMTDYIVVEAPVRRNKNITWNIVLDPDADYDTVCALIYEAIDGIVEKYKSELGLNLVKSDLITTVGKIEGVYSVDLGNFATVKGALNEFFVINPTINITQGGDV